MNHPRREHRKATCVMVLALAAMGLAPSDVGATGSQGPLDYVVRTDARLTRMQVDVCFRGGPALVLVPGAAEAGIALIDAHDDAGRALSVRNGRIDLAGLGPGRCIRYRLDLDAAIAAVRFSDRHGVDLLTSAGAWLWRPGRLGPAPATLRFELPAGVHAATPWPRVGGAHRLSRSAFQRASFTAFGRFVPHRFERGGASVELVRLGEGWAMDDASAERALGRVMDGVSTVQGRFPVAQLLVVLVPSYASGVHFGMVRRGGGHSVAFLTGLGSAPEVLERSWVTWHELSHLHLPPMPQRDAWLYEGLATYYQEILPARMGSYAPEQAWSSLVAGFDRGARGIPADTLSRAAETMTQTGAFLRVYWSGTAFVLEADVALRQRGSSLDRALTQASPAWRDDDTLWTSRDLFALLDRGAAPSFLTPLGARYEGLASFPSVAPLLARLGVERDGAGVRFRDAELASVRDAIVRAP